MDSRKFLSFVRRLKHREGEKREKKKRVHKMTFSRLTASYCFFARFPKCYISSKHLLLI